LIKTLLTLFCQGQPMQVFSTLNSAQQAAQQGVQAAPRPAATAPAAPAAAAPPGGFAAVLEKSSGQPGFEPLPLRQSAAPQPSPRAKPPAARPGAQLDIKI